MKEETYLFFVHFFVLDLRPLLESFLLLFLLLLFGGGLLLGLFSGDGRTHGIAKRWVEGNKVLSTEKGKRCKKSGRLKVGVGVQGTKEQGDGEHGGCEATKDKERGGGGSDEDVEYRITGIDYDPLDTVHEDRREEREGRRRSRN